MYLICGLHTYLHTYMRVESDETHTAELHSEEETRDQTEARERERESERAETGQRLEETKT